MQSLTQIKRLGKVRLLPADLIKIEQLILEDTDKRHSATYRVTSHGTISYAYDSIREFLEDNQAPATLPNIQFTLMNHSRNTRLDVEIKSASGSISATSPLEEKTRLAKTVASLYEYLQSKPKLGALSKAYGSRPIAAAILVFLLIPYLFATMTVDSYLIILLCAAPMTIHILLSIYYGLAKNEIILRQ